MSSFLQLLKHHLPHRAYQNHSFQLAYLLKLHNAREVVNLLSALIREFISNAPLPTNHKRETFMFQVKEGKDLTLRYRYTSTLHVPAKSYTRPVEFRHSQGSIHKNAYKPTGMQIVDIRNLAEVFSTLRCTECNGTLILYEYENFHCWQGFFRFKCQICHLQHANFPSSLYIDSNNNEPCVNLPFRPSAMKEVTVRSVLAVLHSTVISWQSLHRIATVLI